MINLRKIECPKCGRSISANQFRKHVNVCIGKKDSPNFEIDETGLYICPVCDKRFTKKGISTHYWRMHGSGKSHNPNEGRVAWNKDVKQYTDEFYKDEDSVRKYLIDFGNKHSERTIRGRVKDHLIHINGNTCSICKTTDWFGVPVPLVCDHIDGNSSNYSYENFRLVCGNCDMLLPTYKGRNRGKGRKSLQIGAEH